MAAAEKSAAAKFFRSPRGNPLAHFVTNFDGRIESTPLSIIYTKKDFQQINLLEVLFWYFD
jgi:hypothetical protein